MNSKTLFVYNSSTLFEILEEIKEILSFEVFQIKDNELDASTRLALFESECGFIGVGLIAIACVLKK